MFRGNREVILAVLLILPVFPVRAFGAVENVLSRVVSVRSNALGGGGTALSGGPEMVWVNPASASAGKTGWELSVGGTQGYFNEMTGAGALGFNLWIVDLFAGGAAFDTGAVTLNSSDGSSRTVIGQRDTMGMAALAADLGFLGRQGCQIYFMRSSLMGEFNAKAVAGSWGMRHDASDTVSWGASVRNFGQRIRYSDESLPTTATGRIGVMVRSLMGKTADKPSAAPDQLRLIVDAEIPLAAPKVAFAAGAELQLGGSYFLRAGGHFGQAGKLDTVTAGLGVDMRLATGGDSGTGGRYRLDYAIKYKTGALGTPSSFNLTLVF